MNGGVSSLAEKRPKNSHDPHRAAGGGFRVGRAFC